MHEGSPGGEGGARGALDRGVPQRDPWSIHLASDLTSDLTRNSACDFFNRAAPPHPSSLTPSQQQRIGTMEGGSAHWHLISLSLFLFLHTVSVSVSVSLPLYVSCAVSLSEYLNADPTIINGQKFI